MIRLHSYDIVENEHLYGPGKRLLIFLQGCSIHCKGCVNRHLWDFAGGVEYSKDELLLLCKSNAIDGVTIHGGEPLDQADGLVEIVRALKEQSYNVILFTGYLKKELTTTQKRVWDYSDIVVAGRFELEKRDVYLQFRGSTNQRVIRHKGVFRNYRIKDNNETVSIIIIGEDGEMNIKGFYTDEIKRITDVSLKSK